MDDDPKAIEQRGYAKGYAAGRKKGDADGYRRATQDRDQFVRNEFRRQAFLAALPACIAGQNWTRGDKPITMLADRVKLAWEAADDALKSKFFR